MTGGYWDCEPRAESFWVNQQRHTGWWFGTSILFSQKYWESNHPNWLSYFSEGWPNHQPVMFGHEKLCKMGLFFSPDTLDFTSGHWFNQKIGLEQMRLSWCGAFCKKSNSTKWGFHQQTSDAKPTPNDFSYQNWSMSLMNWGMARIWTTERLWRDCFQLVRIGMKLWYVFHFLVVDQSRHVHNITSQNSESLICINK